MKNLLKNLSCGVLGEAGSNTVNTFLPILERTGVQKNKITVFGSIEEIIMSKHLLFLVMDAKTALPLIKELRQKFPATPTVVVSANFESCSILDIFNEGASDYIDLEQLTPAVLEKVIFSTLKNPINPKDEPEVLPQYKTPEKYRALFENSLAVVLFTTPHGNIVDCNEAAVEQWGYSKEQILTYGSRLFMDNTGINLHKAPKAGKKPEGELKLRTKCGEEKTYLFSSSLFSGSDGEVYSSTILFDITDRKKTNLCLKNSEKRFRSLIQHGSDIIAILNLDGEYLYVSPSSTSVINIAPEEFIGKAAFDFIHPGDLEDVREQFNLLKKQKKVKISAFRFQDGNGNWQWLETIATNLLEEPSINGIVINSRVVTASVEMKQQLNDAATKLQDIMDSSLDMIATIDGKGRFVSVSQASHNILGYQPKELQGREFLEFVHPEDKDRTLLTAQEIKNGRKVTNFENRYIRKDQRSIPLIWSAYWNAGHKKMFAVARDGTERQEADAIIRGINEELRISNERYFYSLKATNETFWVYDISTEEIFWSESLERNFGYKLQDNKENFSHWTMKIHPEDRERVVCTFKNATCQAKNNFWGEEYKFFKKNGEISHVLSRGYIIRDQSGNPIKIVGAILDMTDNRKKSLEIEEKNKELMEITWMQSHIARAPLARILGLIDLIELTNDKDDLEEAIKYLKISAKELDEVTRQIVKKSEQVKN